MPMNETHLPEPGSIAIHRELQKSYLEYAMSVIVGRALPDVRDGLKPVHRRSLFAMRELGNFHNRPYLKSARVVGDVIGKYHPHGDAAVYDTIVRLAQDFSMRYPLVDGQGNFGSTDGDAPAAMRYTEVRMTRLNTEIIADLDKETVDWGPNYDNSLVEPLVFPSRVPNLLLNGSAGIAVGMATNIPPHNLTEVMSGIIALIDEPTHTVAQLMEIITGPDFPTGAMICGRAGIREAYETGRGTVTIRSRHHVEKKGPAGRESIVFTEIPFQQNKAKLVERIALLVKEKKIESIAEVRDESDREGTRIVLDLKKDEIADVVVNQLFAHTPLERSFGIIFLCLVNNRPEILNLKQILEQFIGHRKTVVYRRTAYDLARAEERAHLLAGLKIAIDNLDAVVALIRASASPAEAKAGLMESFALSAIQAQAILEMRLQRLTALERDKILEELREVLAQIARFQEILASDALVMTIVRQECEAIRNEYGDPRRTEILEVVDEVLPEDLIMPEDVVVTVSNSGYIKRNPVSLYRSQRRGGKGLLGMGTREEDYVRDLYFASTHDTLLFFTNLGKVFWRRVYEIPQAGRTARGKAMVNLLDLVEGEKVAAILRVKSFVAEPDQEPSILMVTRKGVVKKTELAAYANPIRRGIIALRIRPDDEIISAALTQAGDHILLIARSGMSIRFREDDIRSMGRVATGVKGIDLAEDDAVVGVVVFTGETSVLTVTEKGYGKRSSTEEYRLQRRGGRGIITIRVNERNGQVVGALSVSDDDQVMLVTDSGKIIRMGMDELRVIGRNTQGVRLINLAADEKVVGMDRVAERFVADEAGEAEEGSGDPVSEGDEA
ncbi:MAG: DNA gyrase subunit A [Thermodesulfobacteriota bacterium]